MHYNFKKISYLSQFVLDAVISIDEFRALQLLFFALEILVSPHNETIETSLLISRCLFVVLCGLGCWCVLGFL